MTDANDSNEHWLSSFLLNLDQQRNYSNRTLDAYRRDLSRFVAWLGFNACAATARDVSRYIAQMKRQGLANSSIQRNLSAIRSFYGFLLKQEAVEANPATVNRGPKHKRPLPKVLDTDQAAQLLNLRTARGRHCATKRFWSCSTGVVCDSVRLPGCGDRISIWSRAS